MDIDKRCLEVHSGKDVYFIYARPRSVEEVKVLLRNLRIDDIYTFPTLSTIIPNITLESEDINGKTTPNKEAREMIKKIDTHLAFSDLNTGTYIIATRGKNKMR